MKFLVVFLLATSVAGMFSRTFNAKSVLMVGAFACALAAVYWVDSGAW